MLEKSDLTGVCLRRECQLFKQLSELEEREEVASKLFDLLILTVWSTNGG